MTRLLLALSLLTTAGCAIAPETAPNPWADKPRVSESATYPIAPLELAEDMSNLGQVLETGLGNYDIARANAAAVESMSRAYNAALDAGEAQHDVAEARAVLLEEERRARRWDKLQYWALVVLIGAAGVVR